MYVHSSFSCGELLVVELDSDVGLIVSVQDTVVGARALLKDQALSYIYSANENKREDKSVLFSLSHAHAMCKVRD